MSDEKRERDAQSLEMLRHWTSEHEPQQPKVVLPTFPTFQDLGALARAVQRLGERVQEVEKRSARVIDEVVEPLPWDITTDEAAPSEQQTRIEGDNYGILRAALLFAKDKMGLAGYASGVEEVRALLAKLPEGGSLTVHARGGEANVPDDNGRTDSDDGHSVARGAAGDEPGGVGAATIKTPNVATENATPARTPSAPSDPERDLESGAVIDRAFLRGRAVFDGYLCNAYVSVFPGYAWTDAQTAIDLMVAEILACRTERDDARAAAQPTGTGESSHSRFSAPSDAAPEQPDTFDEAAEQARLGYIPVASQPHDEGLAEELEAAWNFLRGAEPLPDGRWFGSVEKQGKYSAAYWWRSELSPLFERCAAALRSAGQEPVAQPVGYTTQSVVKRLANHPDLSGGIYGPKWPGFPLDRAADPVVPLYTSPTRSPAPSEEMVENIAEALWASREEGFAGGLGTDSQMVKWDVATEFDRDQCRSKARSLFSPAAPGGEK